MKPTIVYGTFGKRNIDSIHLISAPEQPERKNIYITTYIGETTH